MSNELPDAPKNSNAQDAKPTAKSRRRFVQGVSVLVPTILTVGSRSTLAATCLSPSATASINLQNSRPDRPADGVCAGRSPGYWKNNRNNQKATSIQFSQVFAGGFPGKTMSDAVGFTGNANHEALARHLAAAWFNLQTGLVPPHILSLPDLQAMWAGRNGTYAPVKGGSLTWDEARIVDYLKTTMN